MIETSAPAPPRRPRARWLRRLSIASERGRLIVALELICVLVLIATAAGTYFVGSGMQGADGLLPPPIVAALLVANLVPAMGLMVFIARRLAIRRAAAKGIGGKARLHVRLVALFSLIASIPTVLVVVFASLLFQSGVQFWFSDRATQLLQNAENVSLVYAQEHRERIRLDAETMGADMVRSINLNGLGSRQFIADYIGQTGARLFGEAALVYISSSGAIQTEIAVIPDEESGQVRTSASGNVYEGRIKEHFTLAQLRGMEAGKATVFSSRPDRFEALVRLDPEQPLFLYGVQPVNAVAIEQMEQARGAASDYRQTLDQSRDLQFRFNAVLFIGCLLIIALTIWIALQLADRLMRPVTHLVDAARRVTIGDLSARVPNARSRDEVGTLGQAFNRMTSRLEQQTGDLRSVNQQLEARRALIEAVLSGVP